MRNIKRSVLSIAVFTAALIVIVLAVAFSGIIDISASSGHWGITRWFLNTVQRQSVEFHARNIEVPELTVEMARQGYTHYQRTCFTCHGAPGVPARSFAEGMTPQPPALSEAAPEWTPAQEFWITRHGIKMTGMPAFGDSMSEEEIWSIVAFLERLPELNAEEYADFGR